MNLVFDVESTELHGNAFAVAAVVFDGNTIVDMLYVVSEESKAKVTPWVKDNVLPAQGGEKMVTVQTDRDMRDLTYTFFQKHKAAKFWADVPYPVETNFLEAIYNDDRVSREWTMPFPLYDITSYKHNRAVAEPTGIITDELAYKHEDHNPVHDCVVSFTSLSDLT